MEGGITPLQDSPLVCSCIPVLLFLRCQCLNSFTVCRECLPYAQSCPPERCNFKCCFRLTYVRSCWITARISELVFHMKPPCRLCCCHYNFRSMSSLVEYRLKEYEYSVIFVCTRYDRLCTIFWHFANASQTRRWVAAVTRTISAG